MSAGVPPSKRSRAWKVGTQNERLPHRVPEKENESPWLKHSG